MECLFFHADPGHDQLCYHAFYQEKQQQVIVHWGNIKCAPMIQIDWPYISLTSVAQSTCLYKENGYFTIRAKKLIVFHIHDLFYLKCKWFEIFFHLFFLLVKYLFQVMQSLTLYQVFQQPIVPKAFLFSFLFLGGGFFWFLQNLETKSKKNEIEARAFEKQASWFLTMMSSLICTIVSTPFVIQFVYSDFNMELLSTDNRFHTGFVCFFITYLILDLGLGCLFYRQRITLMTGWVHHLFYIVTLLWFLRLQISSMFTIVSILELPTLILAAGSMVHEWRSDFLFGSTFFVLRLVAHAWMMIALKKYHRIQFMWIIALVIYPLHVYWFYGKWHWLE